MSEAKYQAKLIKQLEQDGYYVLKLIKTNKNGIPDILALKDMAINENIINLALHDRGFGKDRILNNRGLIGAVIEEVIKEIKPYFIEVKGAKGIPSVLQEYRIKELKEYGFKAEINYEPH